MNSSRNKKWEDPIVAEIHVIREKMMAEFNNDLHAFAAEMMRRQAKSGRKLVKALPPRSRTLRRGGKSDAIGTRTMRAAAK